MSEKIAYSNLDKTIRKLGGIINAPTNLLTIPHEASQTGAPHVECIDHRFFYVITERGREFSRKSTCDINELLYWIFSDITFGMASDYEVRHRKGGCDFRRILFSKQRSLLVSISAEWGKMHDKDIHQILSSNPFVDQ